MSPSDWSRDVAHSKARSLTEHTFHVANAAAGLTCSRAGHFPLQTFPMAQELPRRACFSAGNQVEAGRGARSRG